jgi:hypothetical protein
MKDSIAIIVCDHGLGHVRRCALIAKQLESIGRQVALFAPHESVKRLVRAVPSLDGLTVYDFATRTSPEKIRSSGLQAIEWLERLPSLDVFDSVLCDNLPEILAVCPHAALSAQFFWHDVIDGVSEDYIDYCNTLLVRYKPIIIGSQPFATTSVRDQPRYRPTSLYRLPELVALAEVTPIECKTDLLVTGGTTQAVRAELAIYIANLLIMGPGKYVNVHVDPELLPESPPVWMVKADFSVDMFCKLKAAICRPGLGILTDLLTVDCQILPFYESGNSEMAHNHSVLAKYFPGNLISADNLAPYRLSFFLDSDA